MYGNHKFAARLSNALPCLFNALLTAGMHLTNNATESDMRKAVLYRNASHQGSPQHEMPCGAVQLRADRQKERDAAGQRHTLQVEEPKLERV